MQVFGRSLFRYRRPKTGSIFANERVQVVVLRQGYHDQGDPTKLLCLPINEIHFDWSESTKTALWNSDLWNIIGDRHDRKFNRDRSKNILE